MLPTSNMRIYVLLYERIKIYNAAWKHQSLLPTMASQRTLVQHGHPASNKLVKQSKMTPFKSNATVFEILPGPDTEFEYVRETLCYIEPGYTANTIYTECDSLNHKIFNQEALKYSLNTLDPADMKFARKHSSPYDSLSMHTAGYCLLSRAPWKLIELNYLLDNIILCPQKKTFADICCAPGGFTDIIRQANSPHQMVSHMITLGDIGLNQAVLYKTPIFQTFITYGDVTQRATQAEYIYRTGEHSQDFAVADGGFDFTNIEHEQEYRCRLLYLSQCFLGLKVVKKGGFFICKMFNVYSKFSISLLYIISRCFKSFKIIKPNSSRPGNSEKYMCWETYSPNPEVLYILDALLRDETQTTEMMCEIVVVPLYFRAQILEALEKLTDAQIDTLEKFFVAKTIKVNDFAVDPILHPVEDLSKAIEKLVTKDGLMWLERIKN